MEERKDEKKKSNKKSIIIIILLSIIILLLGGYIIYSQMTNKNEKTNTKEEIKEDKKEDTKEETKEEEKNEVSTALSEEDISSYWTIIERITYSFGTTIPIKTKDISNQKILNFVWKNYYDLTGKSLSDGFTKDDLDNAITKVFGRDFSYTAESIDCFAGDGIFFEYNEETGAFTGTGTHGHGGAGGESRAKEYFISAEQTSDTITINTKILYGGYVQDTNGPVSEFYATAPFDSPIFKVNFEGCTTYPEYTCDDYDTVYPKVEDQLPITSFIFKKQSDGGFGLVEITRED